MVFIILYIHTCVFIQVALSIERSLKIQLSGTSYVINMFTYEIATALNFHQLMWFHLRTFEHYTPINFLGRRKHILIIRRIWELSHINK